MSLRDPLFQHLCFSILSLLLPIFLCSQCTRQDKVVAICLKKNLSYLFQSVCSRPLMLLFIGAGHFLWLLYYYSFIESHLFKIVAEHAQSSSICRLQLCPWPKVYWFLRPTLGGLPSYQNTIHLNWIYFCSTHIFCLTSGAILFFTWSIHFLLVVMCSSLYQCTRTLNWVLIHTVLLYPEVFKYLDTWLKKAFFSEPTIGCNPCFSVGSTHKGSAWAMQLRDRKEDEGVFGLATWTRVSDKIFTYWANSQ